MERQFHGKIVIELPFKLMTGTHIGNANEGFAIGGVSKVVVRDAVTRLPIVPGSSLKGKLRAAVEAMEGAEKGQPLEQGKWYNRPHRKQFFRHEAFSREEALKNAVDRTFGTAAERPSDGNHPARLSISDARVTSETAEYLSDLEGDYPFTEIKSENFLDRITCAADPRHIERVPAGSVFRAQVTYNIEDTAQVKEDLKYVLAALKWLEDDYIGGSGSRGYGRVRFGRVPQSAALPLDNIPDLPIRVSVKRRQDYLTGAEPEPTEFDGIAELQAALDALVTRAKGG